MAATSDHKKTAGRLAESFSRDLHLEGHGDNDSDDEESVLVIGIDFGTTFSGVAWATNEDFKSENINVITVWPGYGREEGKVPTELFYEDDKVMWGYEIPEDASPVSWFKLLLVEDSDLSKELRSSEFILRGRAMLRETGKSAVDLIADYLRLLWAHTLTTIKKARGDLVDSLPFHVVITVPAIWKWDAREGMQKAIKRAGILKTRPAGDTSFSLAPEPEAAALSTLSEPGRKPRARDTYVICDAGGGTVDLITYEIDSGKKPISMHEAVEGTDQAFEDMCSKRLGSKWSRLSKSGIKKILKEEWGVGVKPAFKASNSKDYIVAIPAEAFSKGSLDDTTKEPHIINGRIHFKSKHIQTAFSKPFADIYKLIDKQIGKGVTQGSRVTGIILVGGLGGSPYLYEELEARYGKHGISILQSTGISPRTAICRGAVYKGFMEGAGSQVVPNQPMIQVTSKISRFSLGICYKPIFIEGKHLEIDKSWNDKECNWLADNQMAWFLKRGDNVSNKEPVKRSYYDNFDSDFGGKWSVQLEQCDKLEPPDRRTSDVKRLCVINFTTDVPYDQLPDYTNPEGKVFKRLKFEIEMMPSGASVDFTVITNGKRQAQRSVAVEFL